MITRLPPDIEALTNPHTLSLFENPSEYAATASVSSVLHNQAPSMSPYCHPVLYVEVMCATLESSMLLLFWEKLLSTPSTNILTPELAPATKLFESFATIRYGPSLLVTLNKALKFSQVA